MHAIERKNGKDSMAFAAGKVTPWHGLGHALEAGAPIEVWRKAAGLDYSVDLSPVVFSPIGGEPREFKGKQVIYRTDNNVPFNTVSDSYKIVQPAEVMDFFKGLTDAGNFELHTAGVLFEGQRIWAMARVADGAKIKDEVIEPNLLLATSFDGTLATVAQLTSVAVVCQNTLQAALMNEGGKGRVKVRHSSKFDADKVRKQLGVQKDSWKGFVDTANRMADAKIDSQTAEAFMEDLLRGVYGTPSPREGTVFNQIMGKFYGAGIGADLDSRKGTVWGLVNAVTEYTDWNASKTDSRRLESAWFGLGAQLKDAAFKKANEELV